MAEETKVRDIMIPIDEYETLDQNARLCDAIAILKANYESTKAGEPGAFHKTVLITDKSGTIVGKISMYDLIRGLVPETAKEPTHSRAFYSLLASRAMEVSDQVGDIQTRFRWLHTSFLELVKQEALKEVKAVMTPVHRLLKEEDPINQAVFMMFKENVRQPLVTRDDTVVGLVNLMCVFSELLEIAGPECHINWQD